MMTDEERARKLIGQIMEADVPLKDAWPLAMLEFGYVRADQREIDAGIVEGEMCEESPTHELDIGYDMACQDIAAAIRKGGET